MLPLKSEKLFQDQDLSKNAESLRSIAREKVHCGNRKKSIRKRNKSLVKRTERLINEGTQYIFLEKG